MDDTVEQVKIDVMFYFHHINGNQVIAMWRNAIGKKVYLSRLPQSNKQNFIEHNINNIPSYLRICGTGWNRCDVLFNHINDNSRWFRGATVEY